MHVSLTFSSISTTPPPTTHPHRTTPLLGAGQARNDLQRHRQFEALVIDARFGPAQERARRPRRPQGPGVANAQTSPKPHTHTVLFTTTTTQAAEKCAAVSPRKAPSVIKTNPPPTQKPVANAKVPAPPKTQAQSWRGPVSVLMAAFLIALVAMTCAAFGSEDATSFASARGDRHRARPLVQKLLMFCLSVPLGAFFGAASVGSFSRWAHSWRSATASRRSNVSSTRARLHVTCLIILAGFGSCGAQSSGPPSAPRSPGTMVVSTVMTTTTSDVALHRRHLNEASASTVGEFTAAIADSSINKILLVAGTYELTSDMCTGSAICIDRALTIEAQVPGSVVLDAKGGRKVFEIQSAGMAELVGLNITGGYASLVQSVCLFEPSVAFHPSPCACFLSLLFEPSQTVPPLPR